MSRETLERVRIDKSNWIPWAAEGVSYKLLWADVDTGNFSVMIKGEPGGHLPDHKHIGGVEVMVTKGYLYYDDEPDYHYVPGTYLYENPGAEHAPVFPQGVEMFAHFSGPLEGDDGAGGTVQIDAQWHIDQWEASGQKWGHCEGPND